jgi:ribose 1,5-bisphosphokinase
VSIVSDSEGPLGPGAFVAVVGASGVGKDAVLGWAREHAGAAARFPRRAITRPSGPGEDHDPIEPPAFAAARDADAYAVWWEAHGLAYGIPATADDDVRAGRVVVANVSRGVLETLAERYARLVVVEVTVSDEVRAARLGLRGRETADAIARRLTRADPAPGHRVDVVIENDGPLADAGARLLSVVEELAAQPAQ